jgi:hypothetical protein
MSTGAQSLPEDLIQYPIPIFAGFVRIDWETHRHESLLTSLVWVVIRLSVLDCNRGLAI